MSPEQQTKLNKIMEDMLLQLEQEGEGHIYYGYSGRGMYGSRCVGFVTGSKSFTLGLKMGLLLEQFEDELTESERCDFIRMLKEVRTDSMGLDTIIYWERFDIPDPDGDEEEGDEEEDSF